MMTCPECGAEAYKVIYMGLPMKMCAGNENECGYLWGFWADVAAWLPIATEDEYGEPAFAFMRYRGAYLPALWYWLTADRG